MAHLHWPRQLLAHAPKLVRHAAGRGPAQVGSLHVQRGGVASHAAGEDSSAGEEEQLLIDSNLHAGVWTCTAVGETGVQRHCLCLRPLRPAAGLCNAAHRGRRRRIQAAHTVCGTHLRTTLPPKLCPTSASGKILSLLSRVRVSFAEDSTECGGAGCCSSCADSPWQRRSTNSTCQDGRPCKQVGVLLLLLPWGFGVQVCCCPEPDRACTAKGGSRS